MKPRYVNMYTDGRGRFISDYDFETRQDAETTLRLDRLETVRLLSKEEEEEFTSDSFVQSLCVLLGIIDAPPDMRSSIVDKILRLKNENVYLQQFAGKGEKK